MFISGCVLIFGVLFYIVERCDIVEPTVANTHHTNNDTVVTVLPKKTKKSPLKSIKNPLSSRIEKA